MVGAIPAAALVVLAFPLRWATLRGAGAVQDQVGGAPPPGAIGAAELQLEGSGLALSRQAPLMAAFGNGEALLACPEHVR